MNYPALKVTQKFGDFYVIVMKAKDLLSVASPNTYRRLGDRDIGHQREANLKRLQSIKKYIESNECAFPNSIILAANYDVDGYVDDGENRELWKLSDDSQPDVIVPFNGAKAAIIDGQHRVLGFSESSSVDQEMELICSVYFDLPSSFQAYLFATINSNQKRVSKSLEYELFGYELLDSDPEQWSPDKLAISIARKLNNELESPLYNKIKTTLRDSEEGWTITFAGIVDGILRLISSRPNDDRSLLYKVGSKADRKRLKNERATDRSPLRELYIDGNDYVLYKIIYNFFSALDTSIPQLGGDGSVLRKTVGLQGVLDFLGRYIKSKIESKESLYSIDFSVPNFTSLFSCASERKINFSDPIFQTTGVGKRRVRDLFLSCNSIGEEITDVDLTEYISASR